MRSERALSALLRPERRWLLLGAAGMLLNSLGALALPMAIGRLIDGGPDPLLVQAVAGLCAVSAVAAGVRVSAFATAGERVVAQIRVRSFAATLHRPTADLDQTPAGEVVSRLTRDAEAVQGFVQGQIGPLLKAAVLASGGLGLMLFVSPVLTAAALLVLPPAFVATRLHGKRLRVLAEQTSEATGATAAHAEESLRQHRVVTLLGAQSRVCAAHAQRVAHTQALGERQSRAQGLFAAASVASRFGGMAVLISLGAGQVADGTLTAAGLATFAVYGLMVAIAVGDLAQGWGALQRTLGAAARCLSVLDLPPPRTDAAAVPPGAPRIELQGVGFAYASRPDSPVFDGLSLVLPAGRTTAVTGPSGAGKSTLIDLIAALQHPTRGQVLWSGVDVATVDPAALRARIAVVTQQPVLFDGNIADNLRMAAPDAPDAALWEALEAAALGDFVRGLPRGLATPLGASGHALSGGQKQRLTVARALLTDADLLVLDEVTSALDDSSAAQLERSLDRLQTGRTVLRITHDAAAAATADHEVCLGGGAGRRGAGHAA